MASALLLLDVNGQSIVSRDYRGEVKLADVSAKFAELVILPENGNEDGSGPSVTVAEVQPVFSDDGVTYCWTKLNDIYVLAVSRVNVNVAMMVAFVQSLCSLFTTYFSSFDDQSLREKFVATYELFDEVADNGLPQLTEFKLIKKILSSASSGQRSSTTAKTPISIAAAVPWRANNVKHKKNEIFLDVIERIDCMITSHQKVLRAEIAGCLKMKSFLSGMPELRLGLNDRATLEQQAAANGGGQPASAVPPTSVDLRDVKFHQCVRLNRFEAERVISFVPPDGEFDLMTYRIDSAEIPPDARLHSDTRLPFWVEATLSPTSLQADSARVEIVAKVKSTFKPKTTATFVELRIPAPRSASNPIFRSSSGSVRYVPEEQCIVWQLRHFQGQREQLLTVSVSKATVGVTAADENWYKTPMSLKFEIPFFTLSRINIRYLKIFESSGYNALPWVRYITQNGTYQIRLT